MRGLDYLSQKQLPLFEEETKDEGKTVTIRLNEEVYDAFIEALINNNLPLSEYATRSHTVFDPVTPSEYIEKRLVSDLRSCGLLSKSKRS